MKIGFLPGWWSRSLSLFDLGEQKRLRWKWWKWWKGGIKKNSRSRNHETRKLDTTGNFQTANEVCNLQLPWNTAPDSDGSDSSSRDRWSSAKQWYTSASRAERERMWNIEHFDQTLGANHSPDSPSHIYKMFHLCQDFITFRNCSPSWRSDPSEICTTAWPRTDPPFNQIHQKSARVADE